VKSGREEKKKQGKRKRERERMLWRYIRMAIPAGRAGGRVYMNETASIGNPED